jgi:hypothetical protein
LEQTASSASQGWRSHDCGMLVVRWLASDYPRTGRRRADSSPGNGEWHFGTADWPAGCRRSDSQIERRTSATLQSYWQVKRQTSRHALMLERQRNGLGMTYHSRVRSLQKRDSRGSFQRTKPRLKTWLLADFTKSLTPVLRGARKARPKRCKVSASP